MLVDHDERQLRVGVRELIEAEAGDLRPQSEAASLRAWLGNAVHERYRHTRQGPGFEAEVPVELHRAVDGYAVVVRGRIDGVFDEGSRLWVEEVKSVEGPGAALRGLSASAMPHARTQALLYALALWEREPTRSIGVRLVLAATDEDAERVFDVAFDPKRVDRTLALLIRAALRRAERARLRELARAALVDRLVLPFDKPRPGQGDLMAAIGRGLERGRPVLAEAPTGAGKTLAAMMPALRFALRHDAVLVFVTPRGTVNEQVATTFKAICRAAALPTASITAVTLRGREHLCATVACEVDACPFYDNFVVREASCGAVDTLVDANHHVSVERIVETARALRLCPFELAMAVANRAEMVIGDYNYAYAPGVALAPLRPDGPRDRRAVVVVDEAHNLFDRARSYDAAFVGRAALRRHARRAEGGGVIADVAAVVDRELEGAALEGNGTAVDLELAPSPWRELDARARRVLLAYRRATPQPPGLHDPFAELLRQIVAFCERAAVPARHRLTYAASDEHSAGAGLGVASVDPAPRLRPHHTRALGTVLISATLSPLPDTAAALGLGDEQPLLVRAGPAFPPEHRRVVICPDVVTTFRRREDQAPALAGLIAEICAAHPGHYMAFFPSFAFLCQVRARLTLAPERILVQLPAMSAAQRTAVVGALRQREGPALLLAVTGGLFAEGVDLPDASVHGVIVVGPGLPPHDFERMAIARYHAERGSPGYAHALLFPAMRRVIQAAGRVIRSADERGIVALLGRRFADPAFLECLPDAWYRVSPHELIAADPIGELRAFWAQGQREAVTVHARASRRTGAAGAGADASLTAGRAVEPDGPGPGRPLPPGSRPGGGRDGNGVCR